MSSLNPQQIKASFHDKGPMLVLAGPGTGKTSALIARILYLIEQKSVSSDKIVAISFSRLSSIDIASRLESKIGKNSVFCGTFHRFCYTLLTEYPALSKLLSFGSLIETSVFFDFIIRSVKVAKKSYPNFSLDDSEREWALKIVSFKDTCFLETPDSIKSLDSDSRFWYTAFLEYRKLCDSKKYYDYSDILLETLKGLENNKKILRLVHKQYSYFLVDEFQDVNSLQYRLLLKFTEHNHNFWVVGDDDQCLYGFRSARSDFLLSFLKDHKPCFKSQLFLNYRCSKAVLSVAQGLISFNRKRFQKPFQNSSDYVGQVFQQEYKSSFVEASGVAQKILSFSQNKDFSFSNFAVLARSSSVFPIFQNYFRILGIPFSGDIEEDFSSYGPIRLFLMAFSFIYKDYSGPRFSPPPHYLKDSLTFLGVNFTKNSDFSKLVFGILRLLREKSFDKDQNYFESFMKVIEFELSRSKNASEFIDNLLRPVASEDGVFFSTLHSSKGLEWDYVFIVGCEQGFLPRLKSSDLEEERRLLYVGLTRSRFEVFLSYSLFRFGKDRSPSQFLNEIQKTAKSGFFTVL